MIGRSSIRASAERKMVVDRTDAPGNKRSTEELRGGRPDKALRNTNKNLAYFGTVTRAQVLGSTTETTFRNNSIGAIGTLRNTDALWLKFAVSGKITFVRMANAASGVSWNQIYAAGASGSFGTTGIAPGRGSGSGLHLESGPVNQNKTFIPGGSSLTFDVRLLTGGDNPIETTNLQSSGIYTFVSGGEWDELLVSVHTNTTYNKREWANFTNTNLVIRTNTTNGWNNDFHASWVQNNAGTTAGHTTFNAWGAPSRGNARVLRGFGGRGTVNDAIVAPDLSTSNTTSYVGPNGPPGTGGANVSRTFYGWRPVLELIQEGIQVSGGRSGSTTPNNVGWG